MKYLPPAPLNRTSTAGPWARVLIYLPYLVLLVVGMCEFKVLLEGRLVAEDIIYAREEGSQVVLRSVIGSEKRIDGCRIVEVDTLRERLVLARSG